MASLRAIAFVALTLLVASCSQPHGDSTATLNAGPMLGDITSSSVKVWAAADIPLRFHIELKAEGGEWHQAENNPLLVLANSDNPRGSCQINGLLPDTEYQYRLIASDGVVAAKSSQKFRTTGADKYGDPILHNLFLRLLPSSIHSGFYGWATIFITVVFAKNGTILT